jgi:hypothetical protein
VSSSTRSRELRFSTVLVLLFSDIFGAPRKPDSKRRYLRKRRKRFPDEKSNRREDGDPVYSLTAQGFVVFNAQIAMQARASDEFLKSSAQILEGRVTCIDLALEHRARLNIKQDLRLTASDQDFDQ